MRVYPRHPYKSYIATYSTPPNHITSRDYDSLTVCTVLYGPYHMYVDTLIQEPLVT